MNQAREEALFASALEIPDGPMTDSHDKQQKLQAAAGATGRNRSAPKLVKL
jgi:hypothetical protein